jgi:hypothetical protein
LGSFLILIFFWGCVGMAEAQQPTNVRTLGILISSTPNFDLSINLKTANQIGVTIPPQVLQRAVKVIN